MQVLKLIAGPVLGLSLACCSDYQDVGDGYQTQSADRGKLYLLAPDGEMIAYRVKAVFYKPGQIIVETRQLLPTSGQYGPCEYQLINTKTGSITPTDVDATRSLKRMDGTSRSCTR